MRKIRIMNKKTRDKIILLIMFAALCGILIYSPIAHAQYWVELPPYNTLWPLWSPALSPINEISGLPTPIVNSLAPSTVLPVVPGLTWDPSFPYPWLLYNTAASGLAYYDPFTGINLWPAPYLQNDAGLPQPIALPDNYASLSPIDYGAVSWLVSNLAIANNAFSLSPLGLWAPKPDWYLPPFINYLSPLEILGPTLAAGIAPAALLPPPIIGPTTIPLITLPVPTLPLPTIPVPTLPLPTTPVPTIPIPIIPTPTIPLPTISVPTGLIPIISAPTLPVPIIPAPTIQLPIIPAPTLTVPTFPTPTIQVPTIGIPTAAVLGFFIPF